jgi:hypothetical protein
VFGLIVPNDNNMKILLQNGIISAVCISSVEL